MASSATPEDLWSEEWFKFMISHATHWGALSKNANVSLYLLQKYPDKPWDLGRIWYL